MTPVNSSKPALMRWVRTSVALAFDLPFERTVQMLHEQVDAMPRGCKEHARASNALAECERETYAALGAYDVFALSKHPMRPKTLTPARFSRSSSARSVAPPDASSASQE